MHAEAIETFTVGQIDPLTVSILPDYDASADMLSEHVSELVTWRHDRTGVGDRGLTDEEDRAMQDGGYRLLVRYLRMAHKALCVLPVSGIDHSGQSVWVASRPGETSPFDSAGWDSGQWGFVWVSAAAAETAGIDPKDAETVARAEVAEYNDLLTGNVYGYTVERRGETLGSVWGYVGDLNASGIREDARAAAVAILNDTAVAP